MGSYYVLCILTITSFLVCAESIVFPNNNAPDGSPIKDVTFKSVREMKNYLFARGVAEDEFLDVVVNNNWELENLCWQSERLNDDLTHVESDEDAVTNADDQVNHNHSQHEEPGRKRRSTAALSCQGQCERSLCPWNYNLDIDSSRTPQYISYAACRSRTCSFAFAGLSQLDQMRLKVDTFCEGIRQTITVIKDGVRTSQSWPIACMCSKHGHVSNFDSHVLDSSGPNHVQHSMSGSGQFTATETGSILSVQRDQPVHGQEDLMSFSDDHQPQSSHTKQHQYHGFWQMLQKQVKIKVIQSPKQRILEHNLPQKYLHPKQQTEEELYESGQKTTRLPENQEDNGTNNLAGRKGDIDGPRMEFTDEDVGGPVMEYTDEDVGGPGMEYTVEDLDRPRMEYTDEDVGGPRMEYTDEDVDGPRTEYTDEDYHDGQAHLKEPHTPHQKADKHEHRVNVHTTSENARKGRGGRGRHRNDHHDGHNRGQAKIKMHVNKTGNSRRRRMKPSNGRHHSRLQKGYSEY